jgi:hypothetical protein
MHLPGHAAIVCLRVPVTRAHMPAAAAFREGHASRALADMDRSFRNKLYSLRLKYLKVSVEFVEHVRGRFSCGSSRG